VVEKPGGKRSLSRPRQSWEYNIKTYLRDVYSEDVNWIEPAQHRVKS
jgi:hypothetical protein